MANGSSSIASSDPGGCHTAVYWLLLRDISFMDILEIAPFSYFWAALVLWGLYAFKSLTVFFPLTALYISSGVLFPLWLGLAVNLPVCLSL